MLLLIVDMPRRTGLSSIWMDGLRPWVCVLLAFLGSVIVAPGDRLSQLLVVAPGLRRTDHADASWDERTIIATTTNTAC